MTEIIRATYLEAKGAHEGTERLLPLLELLEDDGEESPIMAILASLGDLAAAIQVIDARLTAMNTKLDHIAATGSTPHT